MLNFIQSWALTSVAARGKLDLMFLLAVDHCKAGVLVARQSIPGSLTCILIALSAMAAAPLCKWLATCDGDFSWVLLNCSKE